MYIGVEIKRRLLACPIITFVCKYYEIDAEGIEADRKVQKLQSDLAKQFPGWTIKVVPLTKSEFETALRKLQSLP